MNEELSLDFGKFKLDQMDMANLVSLINSPVMTTLNKVMGTAKAVWMNQMIQEKDMDVIRHIQGRITAANYLLNTPHLIVKSHVEKAKKEASVHSKQSVTRRQRKSASPSQDTTQT